MFFLLADMLLNTYFLLPSMLILLNLKSKNYFSVSLTLFIITFFIYNKIVGFVFLGFYILYQKVLKNLNIFLKDIMFLSIFLLFTKIFYQNESVILYFLFNVPFYFTSYIFSKKSINFIEMRKKWTQKKKYLQE